MLVVPIVSLGGGLLGLALLLALPLAAVTLLLPMPVAPFVAVNIVAPLYALAAGLFAGYVMGPIAALLAGAFGWFFAASLSGLFLSLRLQARMERAAARRGRL